MPPALSVSLDFIRLRDVSRDALARHMSNPRLTEHMPLLSGVWDRARCDAFVAAKEACWTRDGLGHWAFMANGDYVGWGGFQKEGLDWDFGLVLRPQYFGLGIALTRKALAFARSDDRIPYVTFLLPPTRKHVRGLERLGASVVDTITYDGEIFMKYRLETGPGGAAS